MCAAQRGGGGGRVDEDLPSRQLYVTGHAAQRSLARSTILLTAPRTAPVPRRFSAGTQGQLAGADARRRGRLQFRSATASIRERRMGRGERVGPALAARPCRRVGALHLREMLDRLLLPADRAPDGAATLIDIGAFNGPISLYAASICASVYAVEADPDNYASHPASASVTI